jgi:integrase
MKISKYFQDKIYTEEELRDIILYLFRNKELSLTSKKQYSIKIPQWISYLDNPKTIRNLILNPKISFNALEKTDKIKHSASNHHIYISAVVAYIKYIVKDEKLLKEWKELERTNWKPIAEHYDKNTPTELQKEKLMTLDEINSIRCSLELGSFERLLLGFYTLIEPIRADYFATEIIISEDEKPIEENYIILSNGKLIVKDFKTRNRYEKIENKLSEELLNELKISLEKTPRKYLFTQSDNKNQPFTRKLFSNWACRVLTRVLKQPMSLTVLRHIYITDKIQNKTSAVELIDIASKMGHSRLTQRVYEWNV